MGAKIQDLGDDHWFRWLSWAPDFGLNPQYAHLAHLVRTEGEKIGAIISHKNQQGEVCEGVIVFDLDLTRYGPFKEDPKWVVESWKPLTLSPSLHCPKCGDHGYIKKGKWEKV